MAFTVEFWKTDCYEKGGMDMLAWWYGLTLVQQIFACIAIAATAILLVQSLLLLLGVGFGTDADHPDLDFDDSSSDMDGGHLELQELHEMHMGEDAPVHDADAHSGLTLFTVRGVVAFFAVGGWTGLLLTKYMGNVFAILIAFAAGNAALVGIALLFRSAYRLQDKGNLELSNALGKTAKVYLTIPPAGQGQGKITLLLQERLVELDAAAKGPRQIPTGALVRVCDVLDSDSVLVEPVQEPEHYEGGISKWIQS